LFNLEVVKTKYLKNRFETDEDSTFVFGLLPENIIYLHLPHVGPNMRALGWALDQFPDAKGLVVDLRHNDGGDFTWAFSEMSRLTAERRLVFRSRTKNGPQANDFSPWHDWYLEPQSPHDNKPIVLLTDRYTISAGERAAMAFQALPNCTTLGDTTCGAQSTMVAGELANGWKYTIATQNTLLSDGKSYEGIGLAPDVFIKNERSELENGQDRVLEAAVVRLK
jgi:C-terminal processing protease CtpA/Prc